MEDIHATNQSVEHHTKKVVQMHYLARNFAARLQEELEQSNSIHQFGPTLQYNKVFLGTIDSEYVTVEEYAPGTFIKYINNTANICGDPASSICQKAECLTHYSYARSDAELMVVDIQGCNYTMFDPEIVSKEIQKDEEYRNITVKSYLKSTVISFLFLSARDHLIAGYRFRANFTFKVKHG